MLNNIREELYDIWFKRRESGLFLTYEQREFLENYKSVEKIEPADENASE